MRPKNRDSQIMPLSKILIANRGEIAVRIARTARAMGYRTVAVFSDADAGALHTRVCDEAVRIGPAAVRESYLSIGAILNAARMTDADAIHPGYGFLSENDAFAAACEAAGLTFIGPTAAAIAAMGNKAAAKRLMLASGVPCIPGYHGIDQAVAMFAEQATRIGYPVMIKAAAGGGGRGMRAVEHPGQLEAALASARSEALGAFGSEELILERTIVDGRHVEIQVFADNHGNVIHLGERDCSIQRRHQKVIEEAPSPAVSRELRARMGAAAVAAAQAIAYRGAGTVEFLLEQGAGAEADQFYFLEMNTRLQVEHPVTEAVTGLDLVAWQLRIANGERLALTQAQVRLDGHAIEARLYAEAPARGFLPQSGVVTLWQPAAGLGVRVDHGLEAPCVVTPDYDPMLAKVIARGTTREEARRRLLLALEDTVLLGIDTNRSFLIDLLQHPEFVSGAATTAFIANHFAHGSVALSHRGTDNHLLALAAALLCSSTPKDSGGASHPTQLTGWRSTGTDTGPIPLRLLSGDFRRDFRVIARADQSYSVRFIDATDPDARLDVRLSDQTNDSVRFEIDGMRQLARFLRAGDTLHLQAGPANATVQDVTFERVSREGPQGGLRVLAPMNGRIVAVLVKTGDRVTKGQGLAVLEAMKMQHELTAGSDGTVAEIAVREGEQVAARQLIVALVQA
jgi:geranyl-CoA carboxylase alpha subunit